MTIDANLIAEVRAGRAVLFLGAGASLGAKDAQGHSIPDTSGLATLICNEFLYASSKQPKHRFAPTPKVERPRFVCSVASSRLKQSAASALLGISMGKR